MCIHHVTLHFICHRLFPCMRTLSVCAWAHPLPPVCSAVGLFCGRREAGSAFSDGTRAGGTRHRAALLTPLSCSICIESITVTRQVRRWSCEAWCIGKGRCNRWKQRNPACLQQKTPLIVELWLLPGRAQSGGEEWLCAQIGSEERVRNSRLHILVWFVSFSCLYC